jgi:hypothetical protein
MELLKGSIKNSGLGLLLMVFGLVNVIEMSAMQCAYNSNVRGQMPVPQRIFPQPRPTFDVRIRSQCGRHLYVAVPYNDVTDTCNSNELKIAVGKAFDIAPYTFHLIWAGRAISGNTNLSRAELLCTKQLDAVLMGKGG